MYFHSFCFLIPFEQLFFKRFIQILAKRVQELGNEVDFDEEAQEDVWVLIKFIVSEKWNLTCDNHLDQLLLCSFLAVGRMNLKSQMNFASLSKKYQGIRFADLSLVNQRQMAARMAEEEGETRKSLPINRFFLDFFIKETDQCLLTLNSAKNMIKKNAETQSQSQETLRNVEEASQGGNSGKTSASKKSFFSAMHLESPLRESVPLPYVNPLLTPNRMRLSGMNSTLTPTRVLHMTLKAGSVTPFNQKTQSPFSRDPHIQRFGPTTLGSQRIIDFGADN